MGYDVNFSIKGKDYSGKVYIEGDRIELCAPPKETGLSWWLGALGGFLGMYVGGALFVLLLSCLGAWIGRSISKANGAEKVYYSFTINEVSRISHVNAVNNRSVFRVYTVKDPSDFVKILCDGGSTTDLYMKETFADVITEVEH